MAADYHVLEPFPLFVDSIDSSSPYYFSSNMSLISLLNSSPTSNFRRRILVPAKVTSYLRLRYYQYEVTFGLYLMTPTEKFVVNTIVLSILTALLYGVYSGLQPFLVRMICRLAWYLTGSHEGVEELCI